MTVKTSRLMLLLTIIIRLCIKHIFFTEKLASNKLLVLANKLLDLAYKQCVSILYCTLLLCVLKYRPNIKNVVSNSLIKNSHLQISYGCKQLHYFHKNTNINSLKLKSKIKLL